MSEHQSGSPSGRPSSFWILVAAVCVCVVGLFALRRTHAPDTTAALPAAPQPEAATGAGPAAAGSKFRRAQNPLAAAAAIPPEQTVSNKLAQFARNRREVAHGLAKRAHQEVPPDVERFFDALEAGNWDAADALFQVWMQERRDLHDDKREKPPTVSHEIWPAVMETYGVAETAHEWPAQRLLEYGEAVLGSLRPGMVYVGGTDPGRFIPTLLNETAEGERHVVLTQNALADGTYLKYLEFLHGDRLQTLTAEDSQQAFQKYLADAQARLASNQLRPGEDVKVVDNRVQVSGQVAVMAINEVLLNRLMEKNPDMSFALEESFPLKSTYEGALPLGPILQLQASQEPPSQEQIAGAMEQWRGMAQNVATDEPDSNARKTYSHMAQAQGNFFADRGFAGEAEQTWQLAREMCPANPEAVGSLYRLWMSNGRANEAEAMLNDFARNYPGQSKTVKSIRDSGGALAGTVPNSFQLR